MPKRTKRDLFKELKKHNLNPEQSAWVFEIFSIALEEKNKKQETKSSDVDTVSQLYETQERYFKEIEEQKNINESKEAFIRYFHILYILAEKVKFTASNLNLVFYPLRMLIRTVNPHKITLSIKDSEKLPPDQIKSLIVFNILMEELKNDLINYFEEKISLEDLKKKIKLIYKEKALKEYKEIAEIKKTLLGNSLPLIIFLILIVTFIIIMAGAAPLIPIEAIIAIMTLASAFFVMISLKIIDLIRLNIEAKKMLEDVEYFSCLDFEEQKEEKVEITSGENKLEQKVKNKNGVDEPPKKSKHVSFEDETTLGNPTSDSGSEHRSDPISSALLSLSRVSKEGNRGDESPQLSSADPGEEAAVENAYSMNSESLSQLIKKTYKKEMYEKIQKMLSSLEFETPIFSEVITKFYIINEKYKIFPKLKFNKRDIKFYELFCIFKVIACYIENNDNQNNDLILNHSYKTLIYFGNKSSPFEALMSYIKMHKRLVGTFVHDALSSLSLPIYENYPAYSKKTGSALDKWRKLINERPSYVLKIYEKAKEIEQITCGVPNTIDALTNASLRVTYANSEKNLQLAQICKQYDISEENFNKCLAIEVRDRNNLPDVECAGEDCGFPGYYILKLPNNDPHAFFLGKITNCCQSIGGDAEQCVIDGLTLENNGFYIFIHKKNLATGSARLSSSEINYKDFEIVGQSYAWRGKTNGLVFDSWELLRASDEAVLVAMLPLFSQRLIFMDKNISRVLIGQGGGTPRVYVTSTSVSYPEQMIEGDNYGDSKGQACILTNNEWIRQLKDGFSKKECFVSDEILSKAFDLIFDMNHHPEIIERLFFNIKNKDACLILSQVNFGLENISELARRSGNYLTGVRHAYFLFFYDFLDRNNLFTPEVITFLSSVGLVFIGPLFNVIKILPSDGIPYVAEIIRKSFDSQIKEREIKHLILRKVTSYFHLLKFLIGNKAYFKEETHKLIDNFYSIFFVDAEFSSSNNYKAVDYLDSLNRFLLNIKNQDSNRRLPVSWWLPLLDKIKTLINLQSKVDSPLNGGILCALISQFFPHNQKQFLKWGEIFIQDCNLASDFTTILARKKEELVSQFFYFSEKIPTEELSEFLKYYIEIQKLDLSQSENELLLFSPDVLPYNFILISFLFSLKRNNLLDKFKNVIFENLSKIKLYNDIAAVVFQITLRSLDKCNLLTEATFLKMLTPGINQKLFDEENRVLTINSIIYSLSHPYVLTEEILNYILDNDILFLRNIEKEFYCCFIYCPSLLNDILYVDSVEKKKEIEAEINDIYSIFTQGGRHGMGVLSENFISTYIPALRQSLDYRQGYAVFYCLATGWSRFVRRYNLRPIPEENISIYRKDRAELLTIFQEKKWDVPSSLIRFLKEIDPDFSFEPGPRLKL